MNPIQTWLDADDVKRMAEQLLQIPSEKNAPPLPDAGFSGEFVGFAEDEVVPATPEVPVAPQVRLILPQPTPTPAVVRSAPIAIPARSTLPPAPTPIPLPAVAAAITIEPPPSLQTSFIDRIRPYSERIHTRFSATGLFILDREGAVIFEQGAHGRLHFIARSLALASLRPGTAATHVHVKIDVVTTLEVIPVDTSFGYLVLGVIVPTALGQDEVHHIMEDLVKTLSQPENP